MNYGKRDISPEIEIITSRYWDIVHGMGLTSLYGWINLIKPAVERAVAKDEHAASMLGEQLQAEIYKEWGFKLLDPSEGLDDMYDDPLLWRAWLEDIFDQDEHYVIAGNVTKKDGEMVTFGRGGSDITAGQVSYGVHASMHLNLTDGGAKSADPRLIDEDKQEHLRNIRHLFYPEIRELGRNGTGLIHPAAIVPLMRGNIPTHVRSTFDNSLEPTLLDNDERRAASRRGQIVAMSLMKDVVIHQVHEPGMAEHSGRLVALKSAMSARGISLVDSQGGGVDGQKYFVEGKDRDSSELALGSTVIDGSVRTMSDVDLITVVGYDLQTQFREVEAEVIGSSGVDEAHWQAQGHDVSHGKHSVRISVDGAEGSTIFNRLHEHFFAR